MVFLFAYRGADERSSMALPNTRHLCTSQHHLKEMTAGESRLQIATSCGTSESTLDADVVIAFLDRLTPITNERLRCSERTSLEAMAF